MPNKTANPMNPNSKLKLVKLKERGIPAELYDGLSVRAATALWSAGVKTKAQVGDAIKTGKLNPLAHEPCCNYGWQSHKDVCKWAGLPEPQRANRVKEKCDTEMLDFVERNQANITYATSESENRRFRCYVYECRPPTPTIDERSGRCGFGRTAREAIAAAMTDDGFDVYYNDHP